MLLVALNLWTGSPLFALWVGSRFQGSGPPKMSSVFVVIVVFAVVSFTLGAILGRLGGAYDQMTGHVATVHRQAPWLRSLRGERAEYAAERASSSGLEQALAIAVVACFLVFEIWFFFFSGSPIG